MEKRFSRAIFLSWYCDKGDCSFCWMSTQKDLINDKGKAVRSKESIYAEALISKACGWDIEFLSCGCGSLQAAELLEITRKVSEISGGKQWLNFGLLHEEELRALAPYALGVTGTVECVNWTLRKKLCPSKPLSETLELFWFADRLGLKKSITVIIGLGETIEDYSNLKAFISENSVQRITFYSLNPHKGTPFSKSPDIGYYVRWISQARHDFPGLQIIAGAWKDKTHYIPELLKAGSDMFTKLPALKLAGTVKGKLIDKEIDDAGISLSAGLGKKPVVEIDAGLFERGMLERVMERIRRYGFTCSLAKPSGELLSR